MLQIKVSNFTLDTLSYACTLIEKVVNFYSLPILVKLFMDLKCCVFLKQIVKEPFSPPLMLKDESRYNLNSSMSNNLLLLFSIISYTIKDILILTMVIFNGKIFQKNKLNKYNKLKGVKKK